MKIVTNKELYTLLATRRYLKVADLQLIQGYHGPTYARDLKKAIFRWCADKYVETKNPRYNIAYLTHVPTEIATEYCGINLDELAKAAIRDDRVGI